MCKVRRCTTGPSFFNSFLLIFHICTVQWLNCTNLKDELNRSYNGGGVVYLLQSELSISSIQYVIVVCVLVSRPNPCFLRRVPFIKPDVSVFLSIWSTFYAECPFWVRTREPQCLVNEWSLVVFFHFYGRNVPKPTQWIISALKAVSKCLIEYTLNSGATSRKKGTQRFQTKQTKVSEEATVSAFPRKSNWSYVISIRN